MGTINLPDGEGGVNSTEITWTLEAPPPLEARDLLMLSERELFAYARDLQQEASLLRTMLHEALALAHRLTRQLDRASRRIADLLAQLRACRQRKASV